jgi:outer membrane protein TolC
MKRALFFISFLIVSLIKSPQARASHPNEGLLSLDSLIQEALANNPDIKSSEASLQATTSLYKSTLGAFSPELSIEGGPLTTKFDNENHSGTSAYGKAEWNLYRGGKDAAERSKKEIESNLAKKQLEQVKAKISREVASAYYAMAFLLEGIAIKEKALELNQEQTKLAHTKKSAGFISEADVIEFELREATIKSDIKELRQEKESKSRL